MTVPYIDTHAHIYWEDYDQPVSALVADARQNNVGFILTPGTNLKTSRQVVTLSKEYDGVWGAVGIHPTDVKADPGHLYLGELSEMAREDSIIAIGETGLDYYWDTSYNQLQHEALRHHIKLALVLDKPIILHNRDADQDLIHILRDYQPDGLKGIFHCFSSEQSVMESALELGFYISFAGNITFKNNQLKTFIHHCPLDRVLTETDSPFMAPVPNRGKQNRPAWVQHTADFLASCYKISPERLKLAVKANTERLFGIELSAE